MRWIAFCLGLFLTSAEFLTAEPTVGRPVVAQGEGSGWTRVDRDKYYHPALIDVGYRLARLEAVYGHEHAIALQDVYPSPGELAFKLERTWPQFVSPQMNATDTAFRMFDTHYDYVSITPKRDEQVNGADGLSIGAGRRSDLLPWLVLTRSNDYVLTPGLRDTND
jgi:hypothetical protein